MRRPVLFLLSLLLLTACGQKGPLYLPGKAGSAQAGRSESAPVAPAGDPLVGNREHHE